MIFVIVAEAGRRRRRCGELRCVSTRIVDSFRPSVRPSERSSGSRLVFSVSRRQAAGRAGREKLTLVKSSHIHVYSRTRVYVFFNFCLIIFYELKTCFERGKNINNKKYRRFINIYPFYNWKKKKEKRK